MKCPMCDGTGTSNTCVNGTFKPCSFCDGTGEFDPNEVDRFNAVDFIKVMEMVKKPLTNEEYIRTCSTEELTEFLITVAFEKRFKERIHWRGYANMHSYRTEVRQWLKEKHE